MLRARHLDTALFRKLVLDAVARIPGRMERAGLTPRQETARARIVSRRSRIEHLWEHGAGHRGDHSMYEAYNAVVESLDHDASLWRVRGLRTQALYDGRLAQMKNRVLTALIGAASSN